MPVELLIRIGIVLAIAAAGAIGGWTVNGWRLGTKLEHVERERDAAVTQGTVLAGSLQACNAGVETTRKVTDQALAQGAKMLELATKLSAGHEAAAARVEALLKAPPPVGAGCKDAWAAIAASRKAGGP